MTSIYTVSPFKTACVTLVYFDMSGLTGYKVAKGTFNVVTLTTIFNKFPRLSSSRSRKLILHFASCCR